MNNLTDKTLQITALPFIVSGRIIGGIGILSTTTLAVISGISTGAVSGLIGHAVNKIYGNDPDRIEKYALIGGAVASGTVFAIGTTMTLAAESIVGSPGMILLGTSDILHSRNNVGDCIGISYSENDGWVLPEYNSVENQSSFIAGPTITEL
jgi:hypothetical protein